MTAAAEASHEGLAEAVRAEHAFVLPCTKQATSSAAETLTEDRRNSGYAVEWTYKLTQKSPSPFQAAIPVHAVELSSYRMCTMIAADNADCVRLARYECLC